tara:strand:- start:709 stop:945 length:237 start_codon:yes stop_codon:yes gene_type:complete
MKKKDFKPHNMYHPKTGKAVAAKTYEQHLALKKKGYGHSAPKKKATKKKAAKKKVAKKAAKKAESFTEAVERRMGSGY